MISAVCCVHCGSPAIQRMVPEVPRPYWALYGRFLRSVFGLRGLLVLFTVSVALYGSGWAPIAGGLLRWGVGGAWFLAVLAEAARGQVALPDPGSLGELFGEALFGFVKMVAATLVLWAPGVLYLVLGPGFGAVLQDPFGVLTDPVLFLLWCAGVVYLPAALIAAAIGDSVGSALNPVYVIAFLRNAPGQYLATVGVVCGLGVLQGVVFALSAAAAITLWVPVLTPVLMQMVQLVVPMMMAFTLGRFVYQNGERFGLTPPDAVMIPALPGARPRGRLSGGDLEPGDPGVPPALSADEPSHDDLESWGGYETPVGEESLEPPVHRAADEPATHLVVEEPSIEDEATASCSGVAPLFDCAAPDDPAQRLVFGLEARRPALALSAWQRLMGQPPRLDARLELVLGRYLARAGHPTDAIRAYRRAVEFDRGAPCAAEATWRAARLMLDELGRPGKAQQLLKHIVRYHPEHRTAAWAVRELRNLAGEARTVG